MKNKKLIVSLFFLLTIVLSFFACSSDNEKKEFNSAWNYSGTHHWHALIGGDYEEHCWEEYSENLNSNKIYSCKVCGAIITSDGLVYSLIDGKEEYELVGLDTKVEGNIEIPNSLFGKPVTSIGVNTFGGRQDIKSITIPNSISFISRYAFEGCIGLEKVNYTGDINSWVQIEFESESNKDCFSNPLIYAKNLYINNELVKEANIVNATKINDYAFIGCNLYKISISDNVTYIGACAFKECFNLSNIIIPDSVTYIGERAFQLCSSLMSLTIGKSVKSLSVSGGEYYTFEGCNKLVEIINKSEIEITKEQYGLNYLLKIKSGGESEIINKDNFLFLKGDDINYLIGYIGNEQNLILPTDCNGEKFEVLSGAFKDNNKIISLKTGDGVTKIGTEAFSNCHNLTSVTIGNSVTKIDGNAFYNCLKLIEVINKSTLKIPNGNPSDVDYKKDNIQEGYRNSYITSYALKVKNSGESEILNKNGFLIYIENTGYSYKIFNLIGYSGEETEIILPIECNGRDYWCIYNDAFYDCDFITSVIFNGTKEEWEDIDKGIGWNYNMSTQKIYCIDGDVDI